MDGTIHPYYTVALARRSRRWSASRCASCGGSGTGWPARLVLAAMSAATGVWAFVLLDRTPDWLPALRWVVLAGSVLVAVMLAVGAHRRGRGRRGVGRRGNPVRQRGAVRPTPSRPSQPRTTDRWRRRAPRKARSASAATVGPAARPGRQPRARRAGQGLDNRWAAASIGSFTASSLELKTGASIMAIGGFTGGDNSPTLAQFQDYVADHEVRYFIAGERFGPPGHRGGAAPATSRRG